jgi:phosphonatase-like hydrolase
MKIDLVVFDMAGTTVNDDDSVNRCVRAALSAVGLIVSPEDVNSVMGLPKPEAIALLLERSALRDSLRDRLDDIHSDFVSRSIKFYSSDHSVHEVPGATGVFERLQKSGIRIALDTGFSRAIASVILDRLAWTNCDLIDATVCSDEVPRGRPHPDMIYKVMDKLGITDARRVAKVGDTPADLREGHNAGCGSVIGVLRGTHSREQLEPHPHSHLIESIVDLPAILNSRPID